MKHFLWLFFIFCLLHSFITLQADWRSLQPYYSDTQQVLAETSHEWEFDANADEQVFLSLQTRQMSEAKMGGFNYSIKFLLNDEPLRSRLDRQTMLLVNRPDHFTFRTGKTMYYDQGDGAWLSIFSNSYENSPAVYGIKDPEPYTYIFDITPVLKTGKNKLIAYNLRNKDNKIKLIEVKLNVYRSPLTAQAKLQVGRQTAKFSAANSLAIDDDGALLLLGGLRELRLQSAFSQPGGGFNYLGDGQNADPNWHWQASQESAQVLRVEAKAQDYLVTRQARLIANRLQVIDTLCNQSDKDIVLRYNHALDFKDMALPICRMGGQESHSLNEYYSASNSTLFYPCKDSGLGIAIEDDFSRNHGKLYYDAEQRKTGFKNDFFYLEAGAIYQTKWSLYISSSDDYYDFLNQVRRDWNINYTIDGPVYFVGVEEIFKTPLTKLQNWVKANKVRYVCFWQINTSAEDKIEEADNKKIIGMGTAVFSPYMDKARQRHIEAAQRWRELFPQIKVSQYYHSFFQGFEKPDDMTFQDSFIVDSEGVRLPSAYSSATAYPYRSIYPMPGNSFWKEHIRHLDFLFDDMRIGWLYWDESNGPGTTAKDHVAGVSITFNAEDGHSALIDMETNSIIKKCGILAVLSAPALQEGIRRTRAANGIVLFNGSPTLQYRTQPGVYNMAESQDVIARAYNTHLGTPLAYGYGTPPFSAIVERLNYGCLYVRTHINYHSDAVSKFYPFTPIELHKGYLIGAERIITNRSGNFGWNGGFKARIWRYDENGKKLEAEPAWQDFTGNAEIIVPDGGLAILEKE